MNSPRHDAQAIIEYLTSRGVIEGTAAPLPQLEFAATPLAGTEPLVAPISGVLVYRCEVGSWIDADHEIADIVDPLTDRVVTHQEQRGRRVVRAASDALCDGRARIRAHCGREGVPQRLAAKQLTPRLDAGNPVIRRVLRAGVE